MLLWSGSPSLLPGRTIFEPAQEGLGATSRIIGHPARAATAASPVASMTTRARTACRPFLFSVNRPATRGSPPSAGTTMGSAMVVPSSRETPASAIISAATAETSSTSSA